MKKKRLFNTSLLQTFNFKKTMEYIKTRKGQILSLLFLRMAIGWHFLYEGLVKAIDPNWTAASFLANAKGPFASIFIAITENSKLLTCVDFCNQWGLVLIGLSLIIGFLNRPACIAGIVLLLLYYLSNPPFIGIENPVAEGSYLIVNKNLIELFALWVLYMFPTEKIIGIGRLLPSKN